MAASSFRPAAPLVFSAALVAGFTYFGLRPAEFEGALQIAWKGLGVGLLAVWAGLNARSLDGWLIAAVLALGALGDVLLDALGLTAGAVAFLAGHIVAVVLYLRNRAGLLWQAAACAVVVAGVAFLLPADRGEAWGIALYALGLGAMAGTAWISRFPKPFVAAGALLFVVSDLLIFARMGPLAGSPLPGWLIWPTYFGGQALIAWGVVTTLAKERA